MDIFERPLVGYCAVMGKPLMQNLKRIVLHLEVAQVTWICILCIFTFYVPTWAFCRKVRSYILWYRVVHKFCNNTSTVKFSTMKANIIALWPSASKFTVCGRDEVEASNCEFWSASTQSDLVCSCRNENWKFNCAPEWRIIWRAMPLFKFISLRKRKL